MKLTHGIYNSRQFKYSRHLRHFLIFFIILVVTLNQIGCKSRDRSKDFSMSGAFALYPMAQKWAEEYHKLYPNIRINISAGGAGKGIADVLSDMVDLGMVSRDINHQELDKGAWYVAVVKDAVVPTINSGNPFYNDIVSKGMTKNNFEDIFITGKIINWEQLISKKTVNKMIVYTRSDACGAAEIWAKFLNKKQEDLKGIGVFGDPGIADAVSRDIYGVGYNNINYAYDKTTQKPQKGLAIIPLDINGNGRIDTDENFYSNLQQLTNAIKTGKYPSPPARELYLVSHGKPVNPEVIKFLKWILSDGQKVVSESGYVELSKEKLREEMKKLE